MIVLFGIVILTITFLLLINLKLNLMKSEPWLAISQVNDDEYEYAILFEKSFSDTESLIKLQSNYPSSLLSASNLDIRTLNEKALKYDRSFLFNSKEIVAFDASLDQVEILLSKNELGKVLFLRFSGRQKHVEMNFLRILHAKLLITVSTSRAGLLMAEIRKLRGKKTTVLEN